MKQLIRLACALALVFAAAAQAGAAESEVARAQFTSAVLDREPIDELSSVSHDADKVFFFTELRNLEGTTVTHRWSLNGTVMAEVSFNVRASRWRVYSNKTLLPEWTGNWSVDIVDDKGNVLATENIGYAEQ